MPHDSAIMISGLVIPFAFFAVLLSGIILGMLGAGGSILTVPIFAYLFGFPALQATGYSLLIVGLTSAVGVWIFYRSGHVEVRASLVFALPSLLGVGLSRALLLPAIPDRILQIGPFVLTKNLLIMLVFSLVMLRAAIAMLKPRSELAKTAQKPHPTRSAAFGLLMGCLTGFVGAGGGFMIVPTLVHDLGMPMRSAIGTSMLIIAVNTISGFFLQIATSELAIPWSLILTAAALAIVGMLIGQRLAAKVPVAKLKQAFGIFVLLVALSILGRELYLHIQLF